MIRRNRTSFKRFIITCKYDMKRRKLRYAFVGLILIMAYYYIGVGDYLLAKRFEDFDYPLNADIPSLVKEIKAGKPPSMKPINIYPYRFLSNSGKCKTVDKLDLLILVKSAMGNFERRDAIRNSWGKEDQLPGKIIKLLFFLGTNLKRNSSVQLKINKEMSKHNDIIQMDFKDTYFNNTIKTMMAFKWAYQHCGTADYYFFSDDDMYVSLRNLLDYAETRVCGKSENYSDSSITSHLREREDMFYSGFVYDSTPHRIYSSKWRVSIEEYPWDKWPTYVTAGAYIVSNSCLKNLYLGSVFVKHFRFDDIFLGIVAKKLGIRPLHCSEFYYNKEIYDFDKYKYLIACHGYSNHDEMIEVWEEERGRGN